MSTATVMMKGGAKGPISLERGVEAFAGIMVLVSAALTYWVHPGFVWLTVFVGANLFQQVFTGFCPAAMILRKAGLLSERELAERSGREVI